MNEELEALFNAEKHMIKLLDFTVNTFKNNMYNNLKGNSEVVIDRLLNEVSVERITYRGGQAVVYALTAQDNNELDKLINSLLGLEVKKQNPIDKTLLSNSFEGMLEFVFEDTIYEGMASEYAAAIRQDYIKSESSFIEQL